MAKKEMSLSAKVKSYWVGQHNSGNNGLKLILACMEHGARTRDFDALARFLAQAGNYGDRGKVALIIRAGFGDVLKFKTDKNHPAGGKMVIDNERWPHDEDENGNVIGYPLDTGNVWGFLYESAHKNGKSFRSADFQKQLREMVGQPEKPKATQEQLVERLYKSIQRMVQEHGIENPGEIINEVQNKLKDSALKG